MKNSKKGISLIVLIITIIVIIILATAILVSVISNNPISEANKARYESDRDNMQAVFTNTVGKIMAENQGVVNVTAGQINTVTKDASEATGEVTYTVDNATVAANSSGKIVFDKGTNDITTYYTGKKLPIYAAGETKWYVDSEGVLSLEVSGMKYGSGEGSRDEAGTETLVAGLYDENNNKIMSWQELLDKNILEVYEGSLNCGSNFCDDLPQGTLFIDTSIKELYIYPEEECSWMVGLVIPSSVTYVDSYFYECKNLSYVSIPNSTIDFYANPFHDNPWFIEKQKENPLVIVADGFLIDYSACNGNVIIPHGVKTIGTYASEGPEGCANITSITIPTSVIKLKRECMPYNDNFTTINYEGTIEQFNTIDCEEDWMCTNKDITVHCTDGDILISAWEE